MKTNPVFHLLLAGLLLLCLSIGCKQESPLDETPDNMDMIAKKAGTVVNHAKLQAFQPAGPANNPGFADPSCPTGVLTEGATFPPNGNGSSVSLKRKNNRLSYVLNTTGLPPGAYTNWWMIFNDPSLCTDGDCGFDDLDNLFMYGQNPAGISIFWATGAIVNQSGTGHFTASIGPGEHLQLSTDPSYLQFLGIGNGIEANHIYDADVWIIVKYHGSASSDPNDLQAQLETLLASCECGANGYHPGSPGGFNCFDPQFAIIKP